MKNVLIHTTPEKIGYSNAFWKLCKEPKRKPDKVSYKKDFIYSENDCYEDNFCPLNELTNNGINSDKYSHHFYDRNGNTRIYYFTNEISSTYWYGEDKKGKFSIRKADHWGRVGTCSWNLMMFRSTKYYDKNFSTNTHTAKTYLID